MSNNTVLLQIRVTNKCLEFVEKRSGDLLLQITQYGLHTNNFVNTTMPWPCCEASKHRRSTALPDSNSKVHCPGSWTTPKSYIEHLLML